MIPTPVQKIISGNDGQKVSSVAVNRLSPKLTGSVGVALRPLEVVRERALHQVVNMLRCLLEDVGVRSGRRELVTLLVDRLERFEDVSAKASVDVELFRGARKEEGRLDELYLVEERQGSVGRKLLPRADGHEGRETSEAKAFLLATFGSDGVVVRHSCLCVYALNVGRNEAALRRRREGAALGHKG